MPTIDDDRVAGAVGSPATKDRQIQRTDIRTADKSYYVPDLIKPLKEQEGSGLDPEPCRVARLTWRVLSRSGG